MKMKKLKLIIFIIICLIIGCIMKERNKLKKTLSWDNINIQLFKIENISEIPYASISNVIAVDLDGNLVWEAEAPKSHYDQYYDISIDSSKKLLIAITGTGYKHLINLDNGKVIEYYLIK